MPAILVATAAHGGARRTTTLKCVTAKPVRAVNLPGDPSSRTGCAGGRLGIAVGRIPHACEGVISATESRARMPMPVVIPVSGQSHTERLSPRVAMVTLIILSLAAWAATIAIVIAFI